MSWGRVYNIYHISDNKWERRKNIVAIIARFVIGLDQMKNLLGKVILSIYVKSVGL